jgi:hypothetical protein
MTKPIEDLPGEEWRDAPGFGGQYLVSNHGRVMSLQWGKSRILKPAPNSQGYLIVGLRKDGYRKSMLVSRLVMLAFLPVANAGDLQVNHKDFNLTNNTLSNLEWTTPRENVDHFLDTGKRVGACTIKGEAHHLSRLTEERVIEMRRLFDEGNHDCMQIANIYGISHSTALQVLKGKSWKKLLPPGWTAPDTSRKYGR